MSEFRSSHYQTLAISKEFFADHHYKASDGSTKNPNTAFDVTKFIYLFIFNFMFNLFLQSQLISIRSPPLIAPDPYITITCEHETSISWSSQSLTRNSVNSLINF